MIRLPLQKMNAIQKAQTKSDIVMMVGDGLIRVNGEEESRKRRKLRLGDEVHIDGQVLIVLRASA